MSVVNYYFKTIEEYEDFVNIPDLELMQVSKGCFNRNITQRALNSVTLGHVESQASIMHRGVFSRPSIQIQLPACEEKRQAVINGKTINNENLLIVSQHEEVQGYIGSESNRFTLDFQITKLAQYLEPEVLQKVLSSTYAMRENLVPLNESDKVKRSLLLQAQHLFTNQDLSPRALEAAEESLMLTLEYLFREIETKSWQKPQLSTRNNIVKRVLEYLEEFAEPTVTVSELLNVGHCSLRTLEYAFKHVFGITPKQFLNYRKMHLIRQQLRRKEITRVSQLFDQFGITNKGRFSQSYYRLFGEYPRDSMKHEEQIIVKHRCEVAPSE